MAPRQARRGYPKILVTLEGGKATGAMSGKLLRYGA